MAYALPAMQEEFVFLAATLTKVADDGYVGGQLITFLQTRIATKPHVNETIVKMPSLRLGEVELLPFIGWLQQWLNNGDLSSDSAREFFIWEMSPDEQLTTMAIEHVVASGAGQRRFEMHTELCPASLLEHAGDILTCGMQVITMRDVGCELSVDYIDPMQ